MTAYIIRTKGLEIARTRFERMGTAAVDATPAMETVADYMMYAIGKRFESQGRRGGGSWKRLTPDWAARKAREGLDPRIGYATSALHDAFAVRGAAHQELLVEPHSVNITSDLPYADTQQRHRPFAKFTLTDVERMRGIIREYLIRAWAGGV